MPDLALPADFRFPALLTEISDNDTMFQANRLDEHYLRVGVSAVEIIEEAMAAGLTRSGGIRSILDLPCGHGRVGRTLRARFPEAALTVCDIDRDGVDFCASRLGARGVYSTADFDELDLGMTYDLIWVGSLITHLDAANTVKFFRCMQRALAPEGLLIITNHGRSTVDQIAAANPDDDILRRYATTGFGTDADPYGYGCGRSIIARAWLEGYFAGQGIGIRSYMERRWAGDQDVLLIRHTPFLPPHFDPARYLEFNPDVAAQGMDAVEHFRRFGHKEDRRFV